MTLPLDELNNLRSRIESAKTAEGYDAERVTDIIYDYLVYAYVMGVDNVNESLSSSIKPNDREMRESINKKIAGKDYKQRIAEYAQTGDIESIMRVAETDGTRNYNDASLSTARKAGARYKSWMTMEDDRVRDTHDYLQGMSVPIEDRFFTYDGDSARYPGDFSRVQNNAGCRCSLTFRY